MATVCLDSLVRQVVPLCVPVSLLCPHFAFKKNTIQKARARAGEPGGAPAAHVSTDNTQAPTPQYVYGWQNVEAGRVSNPYGDVQRPGKQCVARARERGHTTDVCDPDCALSQEVARSNACQYVEGNWYFPPDTIDKKFFTLHDGYHTTCGWKGTCE